MQRTILATQLHIKGSESAMSIYIYGLIDPRDKAIRYVGKACDLKRRIWNHTVPSRLKGNCHRQNWIKELRSLSLKPIVKVLEVLEDEVNWDDVERRWIKELRSKGCDLVNTTEGGEGGATMTGRKRIMSAETRAKISENRKGISPKVSESTLKARAEGIRRAWARRREEGRTSWGHHSDAAKRAISKARTGKPNSAEARKKMSIAKQGKPWSEARRAVWEKRNV